MKQTLPKDKLPKILVRSEQNRTLLSTICEYGLVLETWFQLGNRQYTMTTSTQSLDNLSVDALVRDDPHPASFSSG